MLLVHTYLNSNNTQYELKQMQRYGLKFFYASSIVWLMWLSVFIYFMSITFYETLTHLSSICCVLIGALINDKCFDCITLSMVLHCFSESGVRECGMKGQLIFTKKLRWVIGMKDREREIARMCGETYGVCERIEEAKVSVREKTWASSYTISSGFNGFVVKDTRSIYGENVRSFFNIW